MVAKDQDKAAQVAVEDIPADEASVDDSAEALTPEAYEALEKALNEEREKSKEHWNRLLSKEAELQNFARRARQELDNSKKYGADGLASDLVSVLDSLDQGIETAQPKSDDAKSVLEGLVLVRKGLIDTMKKYGVQPIDPQSEVFNPDYHEAIATQPNAEVPPNTILVVVQKGYMLHDRLLRPARVVVSSANTTETQAQDS